MSRKLPDKKYLRWFPIEDEWDLDYDIIDYLNSENVLNITKDICCEYKDFWDRFLDYYRSRFPMFDFKVDEHGKLNIEGIYFVPDRVDAFKKMDVNAVANGIWDMYYNMYGTHQTLLDIYHQNKTLTIDINKLRDYFPFNECTNPNCTNIACMRKKSEPTVH